MIEQEKINTDFSKSLDMIWAKNDINKMNLQQANINKEFAESLRLIWEKSSDMQETVNELNEKINTSKNLNNEKKKHKVLNIFGLKIKVRTK